MLVVDPTDQVHRVRRVDAGVLQRDFASGTTEVTQYDDAGRCVAKASLGTAGLWRRRFWRSGEGDLLQRDDDRRGTTRFRYDAAHRLDGVQRPDGTVDVYAHDAAGNLLQKPGLSEGYVAGIQAGPAAVAFDTSHVALSRGNKLYRANGDRFHYDARDHVVAREGSWGRLTYVRDGLGRLRRVDWTSPDGSRTATTWEAEYDALGRRTKKVVHRVDASGAPVRDEWRFVWDRDRLAAEVLPDGRLRLYVYPDAVALVPMLALEYASTTSDPREGRVYSFHTDHRGAVERVEDAAGNVVWEAELGPYGEATVVVGPGFHQPFRLVGQYYDAETGLCAHRYRMYSPELGRFLESDPIGLQGGLNVYAWPGCPLVVTDPLGLACPVERARGLAEGEEEGLPPGGITMAARRREVDADGGDRSEVPDHGDDWYFDTNSSRYRLREGPARSRRETDYPSGYRAATWDALAARHTAEGQAQGGPPTRRRPDGTEERIPHSELTWLDEDGRRIDTTPRPADPGPPPRPAQPMGDLTFDHRTPCAEMWSDGATVYQRDAEGRVVTGPDGEPVVARTYPPGHDTDRATRAAFYNDPDNLVPMSRSANSSKGSGGRRYSESAPGPGYSN